MKNSWKKTAAFVLAFTLVAAPLTQAGSKGGLFGGSAITAKAAPPSEPDSGEKADTVDVGTTVSWDADDMNNSGSGSLSKDGVTVEPGNGDAHLSCNFYDYGKNTFKADGGKITKIEIVCTYGEIGGWTTEEVGRYQPAPEEDPDWWETIYKLTWTG